MSASRRVTGIERIATVKNRWSGKANAAFGRRWSSGAPNVPTSRAFPTSATFTSPPPSTNPSLGGWIAAKAEFLREGIEAETAISATLAFLGSHEAVVRAVLEGTRRRGHILRIGACWNRWPKGQERSRPLDLVAIKGICCRNGDARPDDGTGPFGVPVRISTPLYPDWPLAKLPHTPDFLAEHVAVALIQMPHDARAAIAAQIGGWSIPANYEPVRAVLKQTGRLSPFDDGIAEAAGLHRQALLAVSDLCSRLHAGAVSGVDLRGPAQPGLSPLGSPHPGARRRVPGRNLLQGCGPGAMCWPIAPTAISKRIDGDSVLGKRAEDFQPPDHAKRTNEEDLQVYRTQEPVHLDESLPGEDSEPRYFSTRKFPVRDAKGLFIGWGRHRHRDDRPEARRTGTHGTRGPLPVGHHHDTGRVLDDRCVGPPDRGQRRLCPAVRFQPRGTAVDADSGDLDAQETPEERNPQVSTRLIRTGSDLFTTKHRTKSARDMGCRGSPQPLAHRGRTVLRLSPGISGERKRAERTACATARSASGASTRNCRCPYQSLDEDGRIIEVNQAWTALMGYERDEAIGTAFSDLVAPKDRPDLWRNFARLRATGCVHIPAHTLIGKDGKFHVVAVDATTAESATRRFVQTHCVLTDITDREFLRTSARPTPRRWKAVGQLTGGIAHDFNNLLQVVETNLELAQMEAANAPGALPAHRTRDQAPVAGGADLTQQLLAFSRKQDPQSPHGRAERADRRHAQSAGPHAGRGHHHRNPPWRTTSPAILVDANGLENAILNLAPERAHPPCRAAGTLRVTSRRCSPFRRNAGRRRAPTAPATMSRSPSPTPAAACPKAFWNTPSNPSSPPRTSARAAA